QQPAHRGTYARSRSRPGPAGARAAPRPARRFHQPVRVRIVRRCGALPAALRHHARGQGRRPGAAAAARGSAALRARARRDGLVTFTTKATKATKSTKVLSI